MKFSMKLSAIILGVIMGINISIFLTKVPILTVLYAIFVVAMQIPITIVYNNDIMARTERWFLIAIIAGMVIDSKFNIGENLVIFASGLVIITIIIPIFLKSIFKQTENVKKLKITGKNKLLPRDGLRRLSRVFML